MARCPFATWTPVGDLAGGAMRGGPGKGVAHKTQGNTLAAALGAYRGKGCPPHFTIAEDGELHQHVDTDRSSYALRNLPGGVETNRDGAVQVEVVGFSGRSMTGAQAATMRRLMGWLRDAEGIPWRWPAGRPPESDRDGYGLNNGHRDAHLWDTTPGWYAHSQAPEQTHWDPAWTDEEWAAVAAPGGPAPAAPTPEEDDMQLHDKVRLGDGAAKALGEEKDHAVTVEEALRLGAQGGMAALQMQRTMGGIVGELTALRTAVVALSKGQGGTLTEAQLEAVGRASGEAFADRLAAALDGTR